MKRIAESELIINSDGSIFHLHLKPEDIAQKIIVVGDPSRVDTIASFFDTIELEVQNREFKTITGVYKGERITALSHGIGSDNIDIVINELDALVNIDFDTRMTKEKLTQLSIIRVGTSGSIQEDIEIGTYLISKRSIGFDGVLNFYSGRNEVADLEFERAFCRDVDWSPLHATPYVVNGNSELISKIDHGDMVEGVTISANGFYGPQGRELRLGLESPNLNSKLSSFKYGNERITNYEMEGAALSALATLMGHRAVTVCCIIAGRVSKSANVGYKRGIESLIKTVLDRF